MRRDKFRELMESLGATSEYPEDVAQDMLIERDREYAWRCWPEKAQGLLIHDDGSKQVVVFERPPGRRIFFIAKIRKVGDHFNED